ncbi:sugar ABC transporter substrate-binding protein [Kitasatospora sp. NBC_00240]|uniref:sugar ABC transporter substrate-binding protein n=1 Tax=Kitasatospora sp. NBC_00240 TaxID=2903567 RepID=UPI002253FE05|nr:sugar ABC transporter substrate-binding protein [Kitasatospora sp. NBC_00240]MCX5215521.1 sugar ABC transporter substrate-binding protein [Kitasatospora sp. NBC_00240]
MRRWGALTAAVGVLLLPTACSASGTATTSTGERAASASDAPKRIAFFGFAKANSFATATFTGVEQYAKAHNATAQFFDPNFDTQTQVRQIQDAITSKRFDVFIIQANDGNAVQLPVQAALAADIAVVAVFTPIGPRFDTAEPQLPGVISLVDVPTDNGTKLGSLGINACGATKTKPCRVAYLEGMKSLPLDNARTKAVKDTLKAAGPDIQLVADVEGGYTQQSGRTAMQDILQAHPDVNVVIGSTQAIAGAEAVAEGKSIAFVGNGGSHQAVNAVKQSRWFGLYYVAPTTMGSKAAALGLDKARGASVPTTLTVTDLVPHGGAATFESLQELTGEYDE